MINNYYIWKIKDYTDSFRTYFHYRVSNWDLNKKSSFATPLINLESKSYTQAVKKAKELGYNII